MKILHLSDLHIDAGFSDRNVYLAQRVYEIKFSMLSEILDFVKEKLIDLVVIAGDLYDSKNPPNSIVYRVDKWLCDMLETGLHIIYVNGNHDYWVDKGIFLHAGKYERFFCVHEANYVRKRIWIRGEEIVFHAFGYEEANPYIKVISHFQPKSDECIHVGVLHGVVEGMFSKDKAPYYPVSKADLEYLNYDYFALGHIHRSLNITKKCAYAGGFYPRYYEDYASYGGVLIDVKSGSTHIERVKFTNHEIINLIFKIEYEDEITNYKELLNHLIMKKELLKYQNNSDFLNIKLEGILFFDWENFYEKRLKEDLFLRDTQKHHLECSFKKINEVQKTHNSELSFLFDEAFDILIHRLKQNEENIKDILKTGNVLIPIASQIELFETNREDIKKLALNMMGEENVD